MMGQADKPGQQNAGGDGRASYAMLWQGSTLGLEFAGSIVLAGAVGWLLDRGLGTSPGFLIGLGAVGLIGGGFNMIRGAKRLARQAAASDRAARGGRSFARRDLSQDETEGDQAKPNASDRFASEGSSGSDVPRIPASQRGKAKPSNWFAREEHDILPEDYEDDDTPGLGDTPGSGFTHGPGDPSGPGPGADPQADANDGRNKP
jgi:F0F1-type ATP synthase assembly protein I